MKDYCKEKQAVLDELESSQTLGLTADKAADRLAANGKNKLVEGKKKSIIRRFMEQLADPMTIILIVAAIISGALAIYESITTGHGEFVDSIIILAVVVLNAVLGVFQESKAEKAIEALLPTKRRHQRPNLRWERG